MKAWLRPFITRENLRRDIFVSLLIATGFSAFIYLAHFGADLPYLNTLLGLAAIWGLLTQSRRAVVLSGFFIGLLWFYWVGFSFRYYEMTFAIPFVSLAFAVGYGIIFGMMAFTDKPYIRALLLFGLSFFEPFDFNWLVPELLFVQSPLGILKWQFALILASIALFATVKQPWRYGALLLLLGAVDWNERVEKPLPPFSIKLVEAQLPQKQKWVPSNRGLIVSENFKAIDSAIDEGYDMVVLHESAFPLFLNRRPDVIEQLQLRSLDITIVTGALYYEQGQNFNVTYLFDDGRVEVAKKTVLVPFGEYLPLPGFLHTFINDIFFDGAPDYVGADNPSTFTIKGLKFRSAVCFEATCPELFEDDPAYMIAISNNAWFTPSIEPTLQRLLMEYFSRKHGTVIFHVANMAGSGIIRSISHFPK
jgi:apolipoprotein N-acyltransferase